MKKKYKSGFERKIAAYLRKKGINFVYEANSLYAYTRVRDGRCDKCGCRNTSQKRRYLPDFKYGNVYIEGKGKFVSAARTKFLAIIRQNPQFDIRLLFMCDNPIEKGAKSRYSDWCRTNGITFHVSRKGRIPDEWVKDLKNG